MTNQKTQEKKSRLSARAALCQILCLLLAFAAALPVSFSAAADDGAALHQAVVKGDHAEVKRLLSKGADAHALDADGWTPLDIAALHDYPAIIDILVDNGAKVNRQDDDGWTALHVAAHYGRPAVVRALIKGGANVNLGDKDGFTPLHIAAQENRHIVMEILITDGANVHRGNQLGDTPLHEAAWFGRYEASAVLMNYGADAGKENKAGRTPLYYAQEQGHNDLADALIEARGDDVAPKPETASDSEQVFDKVWESIVHIRNDEGEGSGVIVSPEIVATNCHVVEGDSKIIVRGAKDRRIDERAEYIAKKRADNPHDFCLLNVPGLGGKPAKIRLYNTLKVGEDVYAVGNPGGFLDLSLSAGVISQLRDDNQREIQTDAAISPGSSGGGLFDKGGHLIGLTTGTWDDEGNQNLNVAIPADWFFGF